MILESIVLSLAIQTTNPVIELEEPAPVIEQTAPPEVAQRILTWRDNPNQCNEDTHWIASEEPFYCIVKNQPVRNTPTAQKAVKRAQNTSGNTYSAGYCTWYVKNSLGWVPNGWGNANRWASNAAAQGYTVSSTPIVGAVAQTSSGWAGHVAVVTAVGNGTVTVSEMNFKGRYVVSSRTVPVSSFVYIF